MEFYTNYGVKNLGLDSLIDFLYSPPDHRHPEGLSPEQIRFYSADHYRLEHAIQSHTPIGEIKPNPHILAEIIRTNGARREETIYVGDSLMKDIAMANAADVTSAWAKYGLAQNRPAYELLRRVTHWPAAAVEKEKLLTEKEVRPTFVLNREFADVFEFVNFERFYGK